MTWMIYGANGYTGELVARLAVARGERPVLAGRNAAAIGTLATSLGLDATVADLPSLPDALSGIDAVAHCAGPFSATAAPMVDACLATGTHYIDVNGEPPVFEAVLSRDDEARAAGVTLLTGGGFDVVPTDCLAALLAAEMPGATSLEIAFRAGGGLSRGTALTGLSLGIATGKALRRVDGSLVWGPLGTPSRTLTFDGRSRTVGAVTWGDVVTAYHSTGIPTITVLAPVSARGAGLLRFAPFRALAARAIRRGPAGPSPEVRAATRSEIHAEVRGEHGTRRATLTGPNGYDITADAIVRAIPLLAGAPSGAHTPATALGADFVHTLDNVTVTLHP